MIRAFAPFAFVATNDLLSALRARVSAPVRRDRDGRALPPTERAAERAAAAALRALAVAAHREVVAAGAGLDVAHLQFEFFGLTVAACSRARRDGSVEIEAGLGDPALSSSVFTAGEMRAALEAGRQRRGAPRRWR